MRFNLTKDQPKRLDQVIVGVAPGRDLRWRGMDALRTGDALQQANTIDVQEMQRSQLDPNPARSLRAQVEQQVRVRLEEGAREALADLHAGRGTSLDELRAELADSQGS